MPPNPAHDVLKPGRPNRLRTDSQDHPLSITAQHPVLSWRLDGAESKGGFDVVVEKTSGGAPRTVWADHVTTDGVRPPVRYDGEPLESASSYRWRVRAAGDGRWSDWSPFETGLLDLTDWTARWIADPGASPHRPVYLTGRVEVPQGVLRARAYASALGWYRLLVGGSDQTGAALVPRFTPLDHEVEYQAYVLDDAAGSGPLDVTLVIGDGRFRGALGMRNHLAVYGDRLAGIVQFLFETADGERIWAGTDESWTATEGPILEADPKFGETVDLRLPGGEAATPRRGVIAVPGYDRRLAAESTPRLRVVGELAARSVEPRADGSHIVDFGQNFAGVVRIASPRRGEPA